VSAFRLLKLTGAHNRPMDLKTI